MEENYANYSQGAQLAKCAAESIGQYIPPTDRQKLTEKKRILNAELARVDAALAALDAHPDLEEFTKVLQAALR